MSHAHVCDNCKTVAPLGEAVGWWSLEAIEPITITMGEKVEYHFHSKTCAKEYLIAELERLHRTPA